MSYATAIAVECSWVISQPVLCSTMSRSKVSGIPTIPIDALNSAFSHYSPAVLPDCPKVTSRSDIKEGAAPNDPKAKPRVARRQAIAIDTVGQGAHWVLIGKVTEYTGYSDDAIRAKKHRGEWREGIHWRRGPDNRLLFNLVAIQRWMGGQDA